MTAKYQYREMKRREIEAYHWLHVEGNFLMYSPRSCANVYEYGVKIVRNTRARCVFKICQISKMARFMDIVLRNILVNAHFRCWQSFEYASGIILPLPLPSFQIKRNFLLTKILSGNLNEALFHWLNIFLIWRVIIGVYLKEDPNIKNKRILNTAQTMKFHIKDFFSKCDQIWRKQRIWSLLLKNFFMENFIFCAVVYITTYSVYKYWVPSYIAAHTSLKLLTRAMLWEIHQLVSNSTASHILGN